MFTHAASCGHNLKSPVSNDFLSFANKLKPSRIPFFPNSDDRSRISAPWRSQARILEGCGQGAACIVQPVLSNSLHPCHHFFTMSMEKQIYEQVFIYTHIDRDIEIFRYVDLQIYMYMYTHTYIEYMCIYIYIDIDTDRYMRLSYMRSDHVQPQCRSSSDTWPYSITYRYLNTFHVPKRKNQGHSFSNR